MAILRGVLTIAVSILAVDGSFKMLASDNACFSATEFLTDYDFHAPADGEVIGVELEHVSGEITCSTVRTPTKWGCNNGWIMLNFLEYGDDGSDSAIFPSSTLDDMTSFGEYSSCSNGHGCSGVFKSSAYSVNSATIVMKDEENPFMVTTKDTFSFQVSEGCCGMSTHDNVGLSCAKVYFLYSKDPTHCATFGQMEVVSNRLSAIEKALGPKAVVSAHSSISDVDVPTAADLVDAGSWTASGKDVVIVGMLAVNAVLIASMAVVCCRKQRELQKYQAVSIASD